MEGLKQQNSRINAVQALLALVNAVFLIGGVCVPALPWPLCCFCRSFWRAVCRCGAVRCT